MRLSLKNTTKPSPFSCVLFSSSSSNQPPHVNQAVYVKIKDWYVWTLGIYILLIFGPVCVDSSLENIDIASYFFINHFQPYFLPIFSFILPIFNLTYLSTFLPRSTFFVVAFFLLVGVVFIWAIYKEQRFISGFVYQLTFGLFSAYCFPFWSHLRPEKK